MNSLILSVASLAVMIFCMVISQVMLKFAGIHASSHLGIYHTYAANPWLWGGLVASGIGLLFWLLALRNLSLAAAYPWTALIYVITPVASVFVFGEVLDERYIIGIAFIVLGVYITTISVDPQ